jgi:NO-binding membrane sensor protein with MHYT domain
MLMKYDNKVVGVSYAVAFLGSYLTICICEQLRLSYLRTTNNSIYEKMKWFILMGVALGGVAMWCTHFIGLAAMRMYDANGELIAFYYDIKIVIFFLFLTMVLTALGMMIVSYDRLFAKTKKQILDMFVEDLKHLSITDSKKSQDSTIFRLILTKDVRFLVAGGILIGGAFCMLHYTGMVAMRFQGKLTFNWGIVVASVFVAVFAATIALWILFRLLSIFPGKESLRLLCAAIMGIAIFGVHYVGMEASMIMYDEHEADVHHSRFKNRSVYREKNPNPIPTILGALGVSLLLIMVIMADMRRHLDTYYQKKPASKEAEGPLQIEIMSKQECEKIPTTVEFESA